MEYKVWSLCYSTENFINSTQTSPQKLSPPYVSNKLMKPDENNYPKISKRRLPNLNIIRTLNK